MLRDFLTTPAIAHRQVSGKTVALQYGPGQLDFHKPKTFMIGPFISVMHSSDKRDEQVALAASPGKLTRELEVATTAGPLGPGRLCRCGGQP
jgi:hypothetical protein